MTNYNLLHLKSTEDFTEVALPAFGITVTEQDPISYKSFKKGLDPA